MITAERQAFLASRQMGIGGSDIGSLLSNVLDVEYGCERQLWTRLSGIQPDNPDSETEPMIMGSLLEPFVARAYSDLTGRRVEEVGLQKHAEHESLQVHVDRIIHPAPGDKRTGKGVLEIKAVGREMMRKIQDEGIISDYILQLNHGALVSGLDWGVFAIGTREDLLPLVVIELAAMIAGDPMPKLPRRPKILHFEMERDENICAAIEDYGPRFWATIGDPAKAPRRLEPDDPRCGRCPWKISCQGAALMASVDPEHSVPKRPDLAPLVTEYRTNVALLEQCEALVAETEAKFKATLGGTTAVRVQVGSDWKNVIYRIRKGSTRVDGRAMAVQYDSLRRAAIGAGIPGMEFVEPSSWFEKSGAPSRPLLLSSLLPKKEKKKGEVPEVDEEEYQ